MSHFLPVTNGGYDFTNQQRPPRGQLLFDCNFESGNLAGVIKQDEFEYELSIRGDTHATKHSIWFYFRVSNVKRGQRVTFHINNYSKKKTLFKEGFTPMVRSTSHPIWQRLSPKNVIYYRCAQHPPKCCFNFNHTFEREFTSLSEATPESGLVEEEYFFAYSFPYTYSDLQRYLTALDARHLNSGFYRHDILTYSVQGRKCDLLCITSEENMKTRSKDVDVLKLTQQLGGGAQQRILANKSAATNDKTGHEEECKESISPPQLPVRKRCVVLTARVHPGEVPASYVIAGMIDFLLSADPIARLLREHCIFYIVPMLNPDGVALGNYRSDSLGYDLNRHWHQPDRYSHPTILATKSLLFHLSRDPSLQLEYFIDLHGHTHAMNAFFFSNQVSQLSLQSRQDELPRLLDAHSEHFSFSSSKALPPDLKEKLGTGRKAMADFLALPYWQPLCYTLEVSFYCSFKGGRKSLPFTQQMYLGIGRSIIWTFHLALKLQTKPLLPPQMQLTPEPIIMTNNTFSLVGQAITTNTNRRTTMTTDTNKSTTITAIQPSTTTHTRTYLAPPPDSWVNGNNYIPFTQQPTAPLDSPPSLAYAPYRSSVVTASASVSGSLSGHGSPSPSPPSSSSVTRHPYSVNTSEVARRGGSSRHRRSASYTSSVTVAGGYSSYRFGTNPYLPLSQPQLGTGYSRLNAKLNYSSSASPNEVSVPSHGWGRVSPYLSGSSGIGLKRLAHYSSQR